MSHARTRDLSLLALLVAGCACGGPAAFGSRTFEQRVVATADLGDAFAVLLEDRTVAIAPNDASAPLQRLGRVDGSEPRGLTAAGSLLLARSSASPEGDQVQVFSRTDRSVRGLAQGWVATCARGDAPVVFVMREDRGWWGRQYDPTTLAITHEGAMDAYAELRGCQGDAWGLVLHEHVVQYDAPNSDWLETRDTPEAGGRELRVPGEIEDWALHHGAIFALVRPSERHAGDPRLHRIDRQGGDAVAIGLAMATADQLVVGERYACVSDDPIHPPHHVWRVALDGSATEVVHEGDAVDCVGVRGDRVVVLRDGHALVALPE